MTPENQTNGDSAVCRYVRSQLSLPERLNVSILSGNNDDQAITPFTDASLYVRKVRNIIAEADLAVASTFGPYGAKIGKSREQLSSDLCLKVGDT